MIFNNLNTDRINSIEENCNLVIDVDINEEYNTFKNSSYINDDKNLEFDSNAYIKYDVKIFFDAVSDSKDKYVLDNKFDMFHDLPFNYSSHNQLNIGNSSFGNRGLCTFYYQLEHDLKTIIIFNEVINPKCDTLNDDGKYINSSKCYVCATIYEPLIIGPFEPSKNYKGIVQLPNLKFNLTFVNPDYFWKHNEHDSGVKLCYSSSNIIFSNVKLLFDTRITKEIIKGNSMVKFKKFDYSPSPCNELLLPLETKIIITSYFCWYGYTDYVYLFVENGDYRNHTNFELRDYLKVNNLSINFIEDFRNNIVQKIDVFNFDVIPFNNGHIIRIPFNDIEYNGSKISSSKFGSISFNVSVTNPYDYPIHVTAIKFYQYDTFFKYNINETFYSMVSSYDSDSLNKINKFKLKYNL